MLLSFIYLAFVSLLSYWFEAAAPCIAEGRGRGYARW